MHANISYSGTSAGAAANPAERFEMPARGTRRTRSPETYLTDEEEEGGEGRMVRKEVRDGW